MTSKFRSWAGCAMIVGLAVSNAAPSHAAGKKLAFKGVAVGMSIGEFRKLAFPDAGRAPARVKRLPRAYRVNCGREMDRIKECWFEAWNETNPPVCKKNAKEIKEHVRMVNRVSRRWNVRKKELTARDIVEMCFARIDVVYGGRGPEFGSDISYRFHSGRLMQIDIRVRPGDADILYPKLVVAFGVPTKRSTPAMRNRFGATFQNLVAEWRGNEGMIILKRYDGHADIGRFSFVHRPTARLYRAAEARATRKAAKDF